MKEDKDFLEFFRKAPRSTIVVSPEAFCAFVDRLEQPSKPTPALLLAMDRARRLREGKSE
jgi:uncharacterized protein (DUF1778 family)